MVVALSSFVFKLAGAPVVVQRRSSPSIFPAQPTNSCPTHKTTTHNSLHDLVLSSSLSYPCPDPLDLHTPIPSTASVSRLPRRLERKESLLPSVLAADPHPVYSPVHDNQIWSDIILSVPLSEPLHNPSGLPSLVLKGPVSFSLPTCLAITTSSTKSPLHLGIVFILSVPGRPFVNLLFVFDCCHVGYSCPVSLCFFFHQAFFSFASSSSRTGP